MNAILERLRKWNKTDYIILILLGVLVMIVAVPTKEKSDESGQIEETTDDTPSAKELEQKLASLIEKMEGAGKAKVMITFSDEGSALLDKNKSVREQQTEEETVVYDTDDGEAPYVVKKSQPTVGGVVVVAEGGGNPAVATEISNAVMSLFHLEAHKVIVVKMSMQEEEQ